MQCLKPSLGEQQIPFCIDSPVFILASSLWVVQERKDNKQNPIFVFYNTNLISNNLSGLEVPLVNILGMFQKNEASHDWHSCQLSTGNEPNELKMKKFNTLST